MLEAGFKLLDCKVIKPVSDNKVYESYLVQCDGVSSAKMFVSTTQGQDQQARSRFLEAATQLLNQNFPGVGTPIKAGEHESLAVCVYPLPVGQALVDCRLGQQLSAREALQYVKSVVSCLVAPHDAGFVHGSLSPSTIYLHDDTVYLDDFSLSQLLKLDYQTGINPVYTSPEQVRGDKLVTAVDIYSLGAVFYHLLSGQAPYSGSDSFSISMKHLQGDFPTLPEGHCCADLLLNMTAASADARPTAKDVIETISQLLASDEVEQSQPAIELPQELPASEEKLEDDFALFSQGNDDFTARIEARLKEHSYNVSETGEHPPETTDAEEVTEGLDPVRLGRRRKGLRFVLVLITGLLLGSAAYQFLNEPSTVPDDDQSLVAADVDAQLDQALAVWQKNDIDRAVELFEQLNAVYPEDPRPANNLAAIYAARGEYDEARVHLESALRTSVEYATIYENLAAIYAEMARESYGKALQMDAEQSSVNLSALSSQGVILIAATGAQKGSPVQTVEETTQPDAAVEVAALPSVAAGEGPAMPDSEVEVSTAADPETRAIVEDAVLPAAGSASDSAPSDGETTPQVLLVETGGELPETVAAHDSVPMTASVESEPMIHPDVRESSASVSTQGAIDFLKRWADAWSRQDVDRYLTFYGNSFIPPGGRQRTDWENQRRKRIARPASIRVSLSDFQVEDLEGRTRVELIQVYESDVFKDQTRKVFDLKRSGNQWSILRERSLGSVR